MGLFDENNKRTSDDDVQDLMNKLDAAFAEKLAVLERLERGEELVEEQKKELIEEQTEELTGEQIDEMVSKAIDLSEDGKTKEAMELFHFCAEAGNAKAQYWLGLMYSTGDYGEKDEQLAFEWFKKAANQGYKKAFARLAGWYRVNGKTLEERRNEYQCYWNYRDVIWKEEAQRALEILRSGVVSYSAHEEIVWKCRLVRSGEDVYDVGLPSIAAVQVIEIYREAGVLEDTNYVILETGDSIFVPAFVKQGDFVVVDPVQGKYLGEVDEIGLDNLEKAFEKAKQEEELKSFKDELKSIYEQSEAGAVVYGELFEQGEFQKALEVLEEFVQKGEIPALVDYTTLLIEEERIEEAFKYSRKFIEWVDSICEKWDRLSAVESDEEVRTGVDGIIEGMVQQKADFETVFESYFDKQIADSVEWLDLKYYTKAYEIIYPMAELGVAKAQNLLGIFYDSEMSVEKDNDLAYEWYSKAAEQGYLPAYKNLGNLYYECGANIEIRLKAYECYKKYVFESWLEINRGKDEYKQILYRVHDMIESGLICVSPEERTKWLHVFSVSGLIEELKKIERKYKLAEGREG